MDIHFRSWSIMEENMTKRIIGIVIGFTLLLGLFYVPISLLPYNEDTKWSALYFEADLTQIYDQSLDELKRAYNEMVELDYYEINNQFLEITNQKIEDKFLYGFEYGNAEVWEGDDEIIYPTKCFQISKNCFEKFELDVEKGRIFSDNDMEYDQDKVIPIIAGHEYANVLNIGDSLRGVYIQDEFTYEVIGILHKGANINLGGQEVSLDRYLVIPSFNMSQDPVDEEDDMFQVRHYANKLSGKLHYDSFGEFLEFYKKIYDINHYVFQKEGEIIF